MSNKITKSVIARFYLTADHSSFGLRNSLVWSRQFSSYKSLILLILFRIDLSLLDFSQKVIQNI